MRRKKENIDSIRHPIHQNIERRTVRVLSGTRSAFNIHKNRRICSALGRKYILTYIRLPVRVPKGGILWRPTVCKYRQKYIKYTIYTQVEVGFSLRCIALSSFLDREKKNRVFPFILTRRTPLHGTVTVSKKKPQFVYVQTTRIFLLRPPVDGQWFFHSDALDRENNIVELFPFYFLMRIQLWSYNVPSERRRFRRYRPWRTVRLHGRGTSDSFLFPHRVRIERTRVFARTMKNGGKKPFIFSSWSVHGVNICF